MINFIINFIILMVIIVICIKYERRTYLVRLLLLLLYYGY